MPGYPDAARRRSKLDWAVAKWTVMAAVAAVVAAAAAACDRSAPSRRGAQRPEVLRPDGTRLITIVARCKANPPTENRRCGNLAAAVSAANRELAAGGDNRRIQVQTIQDDKPWGDYKTEFELASDAAQAPDIIVSGHEHIGDWAPAGLIIPLTNMLDRHPEFSDVIESLWEATEWKGDRWGVPQDAEARPLYYSKPLLRRLGWTAQQVEQLPGRIAAGQFTWNDMLQTARQAVQRKLVRPGYGWWHRPTNGPDFLYYYLAFGGRITDQDGRLLLDRKAVLAVYQMLHRAVHQWQVLSATVLGMEWNEWHSTVSSAQKVLFWFGGSWNWADWAANYVKDRGGEQFLEQNVGFAPIPAASAGRPLTLTHPLVYMISAQAKYPDLCLLLIAKATTPELNTAYAIESGHLGILQSQQTHPSYASSRFLSSMSELLQYTTFLPNSHAWSGWSEAFFLGIQAVESGDLTPEQAVQVVVERVQNELAERVLIR